MALTLITAPTSDPLSLAEAKAHCRVTNADEDGLLTGYILAARVYAEGYLRRAFVTQTWDYTIDDGWPVLIDRTRGYCRTAYRIVLPRPPLQSVMSITYVDTAGATQTLAADQYRVASPNQERAEAFIEPAWGITWPSVRRQAEAITVRFVCGYDSALSNPFPEPIRVALLLHIEMLFDRDPASRETLERARDDMLFPYRLFY